MASNWVVKCSIFAAANLVAVPSTRPLLIRFFRSARLLTIPARMVCSSHTRRIAVDGQCPRSRLGMEATGRHSLGVAMALYDAGHVVSVVTSSAVHAER